MTAKIPSLGEEKQSPTGAAKGGDEPGARKCFYPGLAKIMCHA